MSDTSANQGALDPKRPWIEDESQLPSKMSWMNTLFNPTGKTTKLHFTRAWTLLFFTQFLVFFAIGIMLLSVASMLGADTTGASVVFTYIAAIVFIVTTLMSFVIHARRLNHAGRASGWALVVLIPLLAALAQFTFGVIDSAQKYQEKYEARAAYIEDPITWEAKHLEVRREEQAKEKKKQEDAKANEIARLTPQASLVIAKAKRKAEKEKEAAEKAAAEERAKAEAENPKPKEDEAAKEEDEEPEFDDDADSPLPKMSAFVLESNLAAIPTTIIALSFPVMLWTLLWVARAPLLGAQYQRKGLGNIMFSLNGRIGRIQYLAGFGMILLISVVLFVIGSVLGGIVPAIQTVASLPALIFFVFSMIAITAKRSHDVSMSGWKMLLPWGATLIGLAIVAVFHVIYGSVLELVEYDLADMPMPVTIGRGTAGAIIAGAHIGYFLWMCLGWPEMEDNKYGPPPIPGSTGPQYSEGYIPAKPEADLFA
jgi:uncharacterized membrane protein YhaH (DUF805 family)